jgi:hypothetical protein
VDAIMAALQADSSRKRQADLQLQVAINKRQGSSSVGLPGSALGPLASLVRSEVGLAEAFEAVPLLGQLASAMDIKMVPKDPVESAARAQAARAELQRKADRLGQLAEQEPTAEGKLLLRNEQVETMRQINDAHTAHRNLDRAASMIGFREAIKLQSTGSPEAQALVQASASLTGAQRTALGVSLLGGGARSSGGQQQGQGNYGQQRAPLAAPPLT